MCELFVETQYTSYKVIHPMRNLSNGEDYALDVFPMADTAELDGAGMFNGRYNHWYAMYREGVSLGVRIAVPMA